MPYRCSTLTLQVHPAPSQLDIAEVSLLQLPDITAGQALPPLVVRLVTNSKSLTHDEFHKLLAEASTFEVRSCVTRVHVPSLTQPVSCVHTVC